MMHNKRISIFLGFLFFTSLLGCVTQTGGLKDYSPKTSAEAEIKQCLVAFVESYNSGDLDGVLSTIHEKAQIKDATGRILSKEQFGWQIESRFKQGVQLEWQAPKISVDGDKAAVEVVGDWTSPINTLILHPELENT
jgi:hypothetical protein